MGVLSEIPLHKLNMPLTTLTNIVVPKEFTAINCGTRQMHLEMPNNTITLSILVMMQQTKCTNRSQPLIMAAVITLLLLQLDTVTHTRKKTNINLLQLHCGTTKVVPLVVLMLGIVLVR